MGDASKERRFKEIRVVATVEASEYMLPSNFQGTTLTRVFQKTIKNEDSRFNDLEKNQVMLPKGWGS